jgi:hypothetical protein
MVVAAARGQPAGDAEGPQGNAGHARAAEGGTGRGDALIQALLRRHCGGGAARLKPVGDMPTLWLSIFWPIEMLQVWWRLVLPRWHQLTGTVEHVMLVADVDLEILFGAYRLDKDRVTLAMHGLQHGPWSG